MACGTAIVDVIGCKVLKLLNRGTRTYVKGIGGTREI